MRTKKGTGRSSVVNHRGKIRICFWINGRREREMLQRKGEPLDHIPRNVDHAEQVCEEIDRRIAAGTFVVQDFFPHSTKVAKLTDPTYRDLGEKWLSLIKSTRSKATYIKYRQLQQQFWYPAFGDKPISSIKTSDMADEIGKAADWATLSPKRYNDALIPLRAIFDLADDDDLLSKDPTRKLKNKKNTPRTAQPFSYEETLAILDDMRSHYPEPVVLAFSTLFFSGMRPGELIALDWPCVDSHSGHLHISKTLNLGVVGPPKNKTSRDVIMNPRVVQAIKDQRKHTLMLKADGGAVVFQHPATGAPYTEVRPLRETYYEPTLKRLGLRRRDFYQTRHTCASLAIMAGVHPGMVAKMIGDNIRLVFSTYGKWIESDWDAATRAKLQVEFEPWLARQGVASVAAAKPI